KITALLASAHRPWSYADHMARRMFQVERVEWLDDSQLYRLMQALIIDRSRHE
ncbi:phage protein GemA/Gp16 family protein, partial [Pseudomonas aeruginosa]